VPTGAPWRWLAAGCFEATMNDLCALLRWAAGCDGQPIAVIIDSATRQSTPESGHRAGCDADQRRNGSTIHVAVNTHGHLLAVLVMPADAQDLSGWKLCRPRSWQ
jgi:hypothetical protein